MGRWFPFLKHVLPNTCWRRLFCFFSLIPVMCPFCLLFRRHLHAQSRPRILVFEVTFHLCCPAPPVFHSVFVLPVAKAVFFFQFQPQKQTNCSPTGPPSTSPFSSSASSSPPPPSCYELFFYSKGQYYSLAQTKLLWLFPEHSQTNIIFFFLAKKDHSVA